MSQRRLRQSIREQRRALDAAVAARHAEAMARHVLRDHPVRSSQHIAAYLAADGEMDPWPLLQGLWALGRSIYLPVLSPLGSGKLWFAHFEPGDMMINNRYGIPEPCRRRLIKATDLDLVLAPLVAFDARGHRIGMGGGYYDRSFAFLNRRTHWHRPRLVGLAYEFQRQPQIKPRSWDVALQAVATEAGLYPAQRRP